MSVSDGSETSFHESNKLYSLQISLSKQIQKAHTNFKKSPRDRLTWNYIQTKLKLLDDYWKTYQKKHNKILHSEDAKLVQDDTYLNSYFEVEEDYAIARDLMLIKLGEVPPPPQQHTDSANKSSQDALAHITLAQQIKLPRIQIPSFDGQYTDWMSFHDHFVSLVHQNNTISNVNKLHLLKQNLKGEAAILLKNIVITENNYEPAWAKLKKRYSNKRVIVNSYLQKLMSMRSITYENTNALKNLIDTTTDCLNGLKGIGVSTETWDPIIIYLVSSKLDNESLRYWEENTSRNCEDNLPTYTMLMEFLETRIRALEGVQSARGNSTRTMKHIPEKKVFHNMPKEGSVSCILCGEDHYIHKCDKFIQMPVEEKKLCIKNKRLCYNCLIPYHGVKTCRQKTKCHICGKRHHTLIHTEGYKMNTPERDEQKDPRGDNKTSREEEYSNNVASHYTTESDFTRATQVLLATALVKVKAQNGRTLQLRVLIDQGSEGSFITEAATQILGLEKDTINGSISGLGNNIVMRIKHSVSFTLYSKDNTDKLPVNACVLKSLTHLLPSRQVERNWDHIHGLALADPEYWKPAKIDLLLGAEVYSRIMLDGVISGSPGSPLAQKTSLGWILSGGVSSTNNLSHKIINMHLTTTEEDLDQLQKFWQLESEELFTQSKMTEEELQCEKIFKETHTRDSEGRYIVEIPFKEKDLDYGDTRSIAEKRLIHLECRLNRDKELQGEYTRVLMEYLDVGHMEEIDKENDTAKNTFYMPHHPVIRRDKITSQVRIVFDASCKGTNGRSLNENMLIGPKLQQDLRHIVMRWRLHPIAFTADCIKMYRQIKVTKESANYQRILWRINGELKEYRLLRMTFETASAPYLATKTLQQLAIDEEKRFPKASQITHTDFFMDDLLSGAENIQDACEFYTQMRNLMKAGGFELQKWASNSHEFMKYVEGCGTDETYVIKTDEVVKTLGIKWSKNTDTFQYDIKTTSSSDIITKRVILSEISRLFDPIGWLAPVIISAKILIQKLWLSRVTWDERVPKNIEREWMQFREDLNKAKDIKIDRWLHTNEGS